MLQSDIWISKNAPVKGVRAGRRHTDLGGHVVCCVPYPFSYLKGNVSINSMSNKELCPGTRR
jgi:hypothetical protein